MARYLYTFNMPGYSPEPDTAELEGSANDAITGLIDEANEVLNNEADFDHADSELIDSDKALVESVTRGEGRADLLFTLTNTGSAHIRLESYANGFGGVVAVHLMEASNG